MTCSFWFSQGGAFSAGTNIYAQNGNIVAIRQSGTNGGAIGSYLGPNFQTTAMWNNNGVMTFGLADGQGNVSQSWATLALDGFAFPGGNCNGNLRPTGDNQWSCGWGGAAWSQVGSYAFNNFSDPRYKKDVSVAAAVLARVNRIPVKRFHWLKEEASDPLHTGWMADEVAAEFPDAVKVGPEEGGVDVLVGGRGAGDPGDDEVALGIDGDSRRKLVLRPAGDGEDAAHVVAGCVEHLGLDVVIGRGILGRPGDPGAAAGVTGEDGVVGSGEAGCEELRPGERQQRAIFKGLALGTPPDFRSAGSGAAAGPGGGGSATTGWGRAVHCAG